MNKIFLYGNCRSNYGPSNVNKMFVRAAGGELRYLKQTNKLLKALEFFRCVLWCDTVVVSCGGTEKKIRLLKRLGKKMVYIVHGCAEYESRVNHYPDPEKSTRFERVCMSSARKIVCVSEPFARWLSERFPEYADKITYINNGMQIIRREKVEKMPFTIAVTGGNRCIKNNAEVCRAAAQLNRAGVPCRVYVFGNDYPDNDDLGDYPFVKRLGQLDQQEYCSCLDKISLLIMNSELESFGLAAGDALKCNCSLLLADNVGIRSLFSLEDRDCIHNPHDVDELAEKIDNVLRNPNAERVYASFDAEACSEENAYRKLQEICRL